MKKAADPNPEELLPLPGAVFQILVALADRERHGYGIMQDIADRTSGKFRLSPGTLYGSIKRMLEQELIGKAETERLSRLVSQAVAGLLHGSRPA